MNRRLLLLLGLIVFLIGCEAEQPEKNVLTETQSMPSSENLTRNDVLVDAVVLNFTEREQGIDPYPVRMLITPDYLRMDEGNVSDNFLLYDRKSRDIFSVTHPNQRILKIPYRKDLSQTTDTIEFTQHELSAEGMPKFDGRQPRHMAFSANQKICYEVIAVSGLLVDAVDAIRGYLVTLAGEQISNLNKTPVEFRTDCMMSNLIYQPVKHLEYGFPLREWDYKGYVRELISYDNQSVESALFTLNPDYQLFQLGESGPENIPE